MNRWQSLSRLLLLSALLTSLFACSQEENMQTHHWKLQSQAPATSISYQELEVFAQTVELMSGGRLVIQPYPAGTLAHGPDIFNAVSDGRVQMGNGWPNWWSGQHPSWSVMNAGPFDFMNLDASMMFFITGEGTALANELSLPKAVIWRPAWWAGMEFGLVSTQAITGLDDLKNKKIRIGPGLPSEVLTEASSGFAIPLVPEEIKPSLESGNIDAVEWTTTSGFLELGLQGIVSEAIVPAIWQPSVLADFLINKQAYDLLSLDLKAILETAIKSYTLTTTLKSKVKDIEALQTLKGAGMHINQWSDADIARWKIASDTVTARYVELDEFSKRLIEQKRNFKLRYDEYYKLFGPYE